MSTSTTEGQHTHAKLGQVAVAVGIGNFLEWYDFAVYGFFAVVIGRVFFASADPVVETLSALAVFAIGFVFRPLGAFILGPIGDKYGRRAALSTSIIAMGVATLAMGFIPGYSQIGVWAPVLLIVARSLQGLSTGGEWTGAATYMIEGAPRDRRARYGSIISATGAFATVAGSSIALLLNSTLSVTQMDSFGWRIPFFIAAVMVVVGLILRLRLDESPVFKQMRAENKVEKSPLARSLRRDWRPLVLTLAFTAVNGVGYYYVGTYTINYLQVTVGIPSTSALILVGASLLVYTGMCIVAGVVVDRVGRRKMALFAALGFMIISIPAFALMGTGSFPLILLGLVLLVIVQSVANVVCVVLLVELFPAATRSSSSAIGYNVATAFIAGPAAYIGAWLAATLHSPIAPAFYLVLVTLIAFIILAKALPESKGWDLNSDRPEWTSGSRKQQAAAAASARNEDAVLPDAIAVTGQERP